MKCSLPSILLLWLLAMTLPACEGQPVPPTPTPPAPPSSPSPSAAPTSPSSPTPSPPADIPAPTPTPLTYDHTHYLLQATLDYPAKTLDVRQTIHYRNLTGVVLNELLLIVEPNHTDDVFHLDHIAWADGTVPTDWQLNANLLRLPLPALLPPDGEVALTLSYRLALPNNGGPLGYDWRQINLGNWYPFVPPYRPAAGWLAYQRNVVGEHTAYDLAGYTVELSVTSPPPGLLIAASAPAEPDGAVYRFHLPRARNFALALSPEFQRFHTTAGEVEILSYAYPETPAAGERAMQVTAAALALFGERFGPYPHPSLSVVQAGFPDGMEFDGLYFLGEEYYWAYTANPGFYQAQNLLTSIAAHETAHQWWYGLVGNDQAMEPWLDEALATFSELLYYEHYYGNLEAAPGQSMPEWWWAFRVHDYRPQEGYLGDAVYQYGSFRPYVNAIYLRGALFLQELRLLMGEEAFMAALHAYAARHRGGFVTAADFWAAMDEFAEADLAPLRAKYFGLP